MKQVIAMGGGGFSTEPDNLKLDEYVLRQSHKDCPKICFVPTASGDSEEYIERFYQSFNKLKCIPSHLSLFRPMFEDLYDYVSTQDIIYVGGGNTRNLMVLWEEWGLDKALFKAYQNGTILAGLSAGSLCWFEEGITDSLGFRLSRIACLGIIEGSHSPHYDGEPERRPAYQQMIVNGDLLDGIAAEDGVGLHYIDGELKHIVSSRSNAKAYYVRSVNGSIQEEAIDATYLE